MNILGIDDLKEGMVLLEEVKNLHGQLLIGKDVAITEKHIRMLKSWGIQKITIKGEGDDAQAVLDPLSALGEEAAGKLRAYVDDLFKLTDSNDTFIQRLKELVTIRKAHQTIEGGHRA